MICRIAATNGKANDSWCSEAKEPVSTSIKTALATPTKTAARPMKAETSVRAIVVNLPSVFFSAANCVVTNTPVLLVSLDGSHDHRHDGQEKWIVENCRYRGIEMAIKVGQWHPW